ncbi:MAG: hypothetical protein WBO19_02340 [Terriglobia bacterium]
MKRTIFGLATILVVCLTVLTVLAVRPLRTVKAHRGCSNRTLFGDYGATLSGEQQGDGPVTMVALLHFDGNAGLSGGAHGYQIVGFAVSGPGSSWEGGTYEVLPDCSITATIPGTPPATLQGVVVNADGNEVIGELFYPRTTPITSPDQPNAGMGTFDMKKVSDSD